MEQTTIIHKWENSGINYTLHNNLSVTSDKSDIQIKELNLNEKSFIANGKVYIIERNLSTDRWIKQNELETALGFGMSTKELRDAMIKIYNLTNDRGGRIGDIARIAYDSANGITKMADREPHILKFCALFINTTDEDRRTITDDEISVKCEDFRKEGISIESFFVFALSLMQNLAGDYKKAIQNGLDEAEDLLQVKSTPK